MHTIPGVSLYYTGQTFENLGQAGLYLLPLEFGLDRIHLIFCLFFNIYNISMSFNFYTTVRGYELDSYNHLNNAVYLNYLEEARWQIFKNFELFDYFSKNKMLLVVTEVSIKYAREAKLFDELVIKTEIKRENPYILFLHKIYNTKTNLKISQAKVKTLLIDANKTPVDIPEELLKKIDSVKGNI